VAGCHVDLSNRAEARDQWQRHYTLSPGGTLEIRNTSGTIHIEQGTDSGIDVTATRLVRAFNDEAAKDALAKFEIQETVAPDRVAIDSSNRGAGLMINLQRQVEYHVRIPDWVNLRLDTTNGAIELSGDHLTGAVKAESTNGHVRAKGLEGNVSVETTNGTITLDVNKLGADGISCDTTNGAVSVTVPASARARVSARVTNGRITHEGLELAVAEQSRHRLDGTLNGGGPGIKIETTNGSIQLRGK
jgi:hypothetical protein